MRELLKNHRSVTQLLLATMMLLFATTTTAQTHYRSQVEIGAKAGVSLSRVFFNPSVKQYMLPGAVVGFTLRYIEENHFGLIAELNFEQRGWKENLQPSAYSYTRSINYIQIPLLAHIYFGSRIRFFFNAGPEIGFRISSSQKSNFNPADLTAYPDFPPNYHTKEMTMPINQKIDFGISAGIGGEYHISPRHTIDLEARFYYGLGNILKSGRQEPFAASNTMSVMITTGYRFRIK